MVRQTAEPLNVLNSVIFQVTMFHCLVVWDNADELFFTIGLILVLAGYLGHMFFSTKSKAITLGQDIKTFMFLTSSIAFLTPLLQSLTVSYSNDTIILLASIFCIIHCFAYDFQINSTAVQRTTYVRSSTSLNAIFFAAILLASRLQRISSVFVLLSINLLIFGFGPYFRHELRKINNLWFELLTLG